MPNVWQMHSVAERKKFNKVQGRSVRSGGAPKKDVGNWRTLNIGEVEWVLVPHRCWPLFSGGFVACTKQTQCPSLFQNIWKTSCFSTRNHPDNWLPWINPTRTTDRAGWQKPSSKRRSSIFEEYYLNDVEKLGFSMSENLGGAGTKLDGRRNFE